MSDVKGSPAFGQSLNFIVAPAIHVVKVEVDGRVVYEGNDLEKAQAVHDEWLRRMFR